eukprot:556851-Rhodomonas_salina.1
MFCTGFEGGGASFCKSVRCRREEKDRLIYFSSLDDCVGVQHGQVNQLDARAHGRAGAPLSLLAEALSTAAMLAFMVTMLAFVAKTLRKHCGSWC